MGVGVGPDVVSCGQFLTDEFRVGKGRRSDHEERGRNSVSAEHIEDARRPSGVRAVVEGQGHLSCRRLHRSHRAAREVDYRTRRSQPDDR